MKWNRRWRCLLQAVGLACAVTSMVGAASAQGDDAAQSSGAPQTASATAPSIAALDQAFRQQDHTIVQLRRFFDGRGGVVTVREELRVDADGTDSPPHSLGFLGVEGELPGSPVHQKWAQVYSRHAGTFYRHGCFRIRDLGKAQQNYTLHHFGMVTRAGRSAHRIVIFPGRLDKAIWLLDVDVTTLVPLYTAEYDARFRLLSEIEAVSFANSAQLGTPGPSLTSVSRQPTVAAAKALMGNPAGVIEPSTAFVGEYGLASIEVTANPLNNRQTLTLCYTDGVDGFFVVQTPGTSDYFAGLPVNKGATSFGHTISRYRDASMTVLLFWDQGIGFQVTGRGSLTRLDAMAKAIYTQAILTQ